MFFWGEPTLADALDQSELVSKPRKGILQLVHVVLDVAVDRVPVRTVSLLRLVVVPLFHLVLVLVVLGVVLVRVLGIGRRRDVLVDVEALSVLAMVPHRLCHGSLGLGPPRSNSEGVLSAMHVSSGDWGIVFGPSWCSWKCLEVLVWSPWSSTEIGDRKMLWRTGCCCQCCSADCSSAGWSPNSTSHGPGMLEGPRTGQVASEQRLDAQSAPRTAQESTNSGRRCRGLPTTSRKSRKTQQRLMRGSVATDHNTNTNHTPDVTHCCPARPCSPPVTPLQRVCRQPTVLGLGPL